MFQLKAFCGNIPQACWQPPTALALVGRRPFLWPRPNTNAALEAALLVASAKHQRSARGGSFSGPRPNINAALGAALLRASTKQLHNDGCGPSQGLGLLSRSVVLTNHRRLTNPATSIKGDRLGLRNQFSSVRLSCSYSTLYT